MSLLPWHIRPDSIEVLSDEKALRSLRRYFSILSGEEKPRYKLIKRIEVEYSENDPLEELWNLHGDFTKEAKKMIERGELEEEEEKESNLLGLKTEISKRILESCSFCERKCGVNRLEGERGACGVGLESRVSSEFLHWGEEPELVPSYTIFFSGCTFKCVFCQNWDISQYPEEGTKVSPKVIATWMEEAERKGARNVNFVGGDPTPNLHTILEALLYSKADLPVVWNSNMYLTEEAMALLDQAVDVYLTDFKYGNDDCALKYSKVIKYWEIITRNHLLSKESSEVIIRHLVMPNHIECCTRPILKWISENLGREVRVNVMGQYRPCYKAGEYEEISRALRISELEEALKIAEEFGLENVIH
ncbi:radical SAM protein [Thermococci archaeon]|nr:MAG: radical SAM protein [Thermococci archaeon]